MKQCTKSYRTFIICAETREYAIQSWVRQMRFGFSQRQVAHNFTFTVYKEITLILELFYNRSRGFFIGALSK